MRRFLGALLAVTALVAIAVPGASALRVGDSCVGNETVPGTTAIGLGDLLPAGVITEWSANLAPPLSGLEQQLVVTKRSYGGTDEVLLGESEPETVLPGSRSVFKTRIPVPRGGHVGLRGATGTAICKGAVGHVAQLVSGPWQLNERRAIAATPDLGVPAVVTVESDRDGDGYGDFSQDRCPAGKKTQEACPKVRVRVGDTRVTAKTIYVEVRASSATKLDVYGQVGWKLRQKNGKKVGIIQGIGARHSREARGGTTYTFPVPLEPTILRRLSRIPPSQHLTAQMTAVSVDIADRVAFARFNVRLPGRG